MLLFAGRHDWERVIPLCSRVFCYLSLLLGVHVMRIRDKNERGSVGFRGGATLEVETDGLSRRINAWLLPLIRLNLRAGKRVRFTQPTSTALRSLKLLYTP